MKLAALSDVVLIVVNTHVARKSSRPMAPNNAEGDEILDLRIGSLPSTLFVPYR
jgi:hypothetical protein